MKLFILKEDGDDVLKKKTRPVRKVTAAIRRLASAMIDAMHEHGGVGLAAPQVGKDIRMTVLYHPELHPEPFAMIDPEILEMSDELVSLEEGCLSVPDWHVPIARSRQIRVRFMDIAGKTQTVEYVDMMARIVQHEIDHLDGRLIVERMDVQTRMQFNAEYIPPSQRPPVS